MSRVAKSASALERAFLVMLVLEAMEVRLFRPRKTRRRSWRSLDSSLGYLN
jgi:energy-coupling factor transporter transmembrane protein EcfT